MRGWAAGRAGGRPAADGQSSGTRRLRTAVVLALLAAVLPMTPAQAAPPAAPAGPALQAPDQDDTSDPGRPVRIDVSRFEPRTVTPGSEISVTGTLTNTGKQPITSLAVRLQRGEPVTSRADLAEAASDPATDVAATFRAVRGGLAPGDSVDFTYAVPSAELQIARDGVYPALLNVNGTIDGGQRRRVGELTTFVVQQPVVTTPRTTVAWLWPLVERTHRSAAGGFVDDGLAESISDGGRLDRALEVIERLPATVPAGSTRPVPVMPVTLAIDPALVEELTLMAAGPYAVDGTADAGTGTEAAAAFLHRLRTVAAVNPVAALPYGDADVDSLDAAGLADVVTRSLPGTPAGTAQDRPAEDGQDGAAATSAAPSGTGAPEPEQDPQSTTGAGEQILTDALDVQPRTDLVWAAGGSLRPATVGTLQAGGVRELVLGPHGLTDGARAVGAEGGPAVARATVPAPQGDIGALVADPTLSEVAGSAERAPGGPRIAEQRYLAELAVLGRQTAPSAPQTVLVAPPRAIDAGPDGAGAMLADTAGTPWLRPGTIDDLIAGPAAAAGALADPADAARLDGTGLTRIAESVAVRDDLAGAVVDDPDRALAAYDAATARASSVAWRDDAEGFRAAADDLARTMARLRGRVTLLAPADGTYSLASSDAPLVLTVQNDLPFAVRVLLDVSTRGKRGLDIGDIGPQVLPPQQRTTLTVPTELRQSGGFAVSAGLTTPDGGPLGDRVQMQVKSTAYGSISLLITIGAGLLLGLLFLRRLVRFVLRRRRAAGGAELPGGAPEGAAVLPPTRSPV